MKLIKNIEEITDVISSNDVPVNSVILLVIADRCRHFVIPVHIAPNVFKLIEISISSRYIPNRWTDAEYTWENLMNLEITSFDFKVVARYLFNDVAEMFEYILKH